MRKLPKGAPKISVNEAAGTLTLKGKLAWTQVRDGPGLRRETTDCRFVLLIEDTPFDRKVKARPNGESRITDARGALAVGEPKETAETDVGQTLRVASCRAPKGGRVEGLKTQGLVVEPVVKIFDQGALDGSRHFRAFASMNKALTRITDVRVGMLVEQPVIWTDRCT